MTRMEVGSSGQCRNTSGSRPMATQNSFPSSTDPGTAPFADRCLNHSAWSATDAVSRFGTITTSASILSLNALYCSREMPWGNLRATKLESLTNNS